MSKITIEKLNINGEGVSFQDGKKYVVPYSLPSETLDVAKIQEKSNFVGCEIKSILSASPKRIKPICKYFLQCGGCDKMNIYPIDCLNLKKENIQEYFQDIYEGEIIANECKTPLFYRNKVAFVVQGNKVGLQKRLSNTIVEVDKCLVAKDEINKVLDLFKCYLGTIKNDSITRLVVRTLENQTSIVLVCTKKPSNLEYFISLLKETYDKNFGLYLNYNKSKNEIFSANFEHICGLRELKSTYNDLVFYIKPYSFMQINDEMRDKLYQNVAKKINGGVVVEGYSGAGLLSAILSKNATQVYSIEINASASRDAEKTKIANKITNLANICGDIKVELPKIIEKNKDATFVIDPPRSGVDKTTLNLLKSCKVKRIIYISCNPYTLKQNLVYLSDTYKAISFDIFDLFPQTFDIESVVELELK